MMDMTFKYFFTIALCLNLLGCASSSIDIVKPYVEPQFGMTKQQMLDLLGKPESIEIYKELDLTKKEFYFYVKRYQSSQLKVPVCLINNKVVGWGKSYYEDHVNSDDLKIK